MASLSFCIWLPSLGGKETRAPALRVPRAETRLTVYRSLPYRNSSQAGQKGRLHDGTLDHEKVVSEDHCFLKSAWEYLVKNILKFIEMLLKFENDFKISEFYRLQTFLKN